MSSRQRRCWAVSAAESVRLQSNVIACACRGQMTSRIQRIQCEQVIALDLDIEATAGLGFAVIPSALGSRRRHGQRERCCQQCEDRMSHFAFPLQNPCLSSLHEIANAAPPVSCLAARLRPMEYLRRHYVTGDAGEGAHTAFNRRPRRTVARDVPMSFIPNSWSRSRRTTLLRSTE